MRVYEYVRYCIKCQALVFSWRQTVTETNVEYCVTNEDGWPETTHAKTYDREEYDFECTKCDGTVKELGLEQDAYEIWEKLIPKEKSIQVKFNIADYNNESISKELFTECLVEGNL